MERLEKILENLFEGVYFVDRDRCITFWNKGAEVITGFSREDVVGRRCSDNILNHLDSSGNALCMTTCPLALTIKDGMNREVEAFLHHKQGHRVPVVIRVAPYRDETGQIVGAVEMFTSASTRESLLARVAELEKLSLLDELTRIGNRRFIEMQLQHRCQEMKRYGWSSGVLLLDIDHFKEINDTFGHSTGDAVLRLVTSTMTSNSRQFDVFGRLGGEEFVGILRNVSCRQMVTIAEKLRVLIEHSYLVQADRRIQVTVSLGGTLITPEDTVYTVLKRADRLMYESKQKGRNRLSTDCLAGASLSKPTLS